MHRCTGAHASAPRRPSPLEFVWELPRRLAHLPACGGAQLRLAISSPRGVRPFEGGPRSRHQADAMFARLSDGAVSRWIDEVWRETKCCGGIRGAPAPATEAAPVQAAPAQAPPQAAGRERSSTPPMSAQGSADAPRRSIRQEAGVAAAGRRMRGGAVAQAATLAGRTGRRGSQVRSDDGSGSHARDGLQEVEVPCDARAGGDLRGLIGYSKNHCKQESEQSPSEPSSTDESLREQMEANAVIAKKFMTRKQRPGIPSLGLACSVSEVSSRTRQPQEEEEEETTETPVATTASASPMTYLPSAEEDDRNIDDRWSEKRAELRPKLAQASKKAVFKDIGLKNTTAQKKQQKELAKTIDDYTAAMSQKIRSVAGPDAPEENFAASIDPAKLVIEAQGVLWGGRL